MVGGTVEMSTGGIDELFIVDEVESCVILVVKTLFIEGVVGIGSGSLAGSSHVYPFGHVKQS